jgi:hypothetical protein
MPPPLIGMIVNLTIFVYCYFGWFSRERVMRAVCNLCAKPRTLGLLVRDAYALTVIAVGTVLPMLAAAQDFGEGKPGPQFKQAPLQKGAEAAAAAQDADMILGLVHANTLFFIVAGVGAVFWFLFGGGRKARVGRSGP